MGTNYYWYPKSNPCPTCGHDPIEPIHIGKSSAGWRFMFHGTDEIRSWEQWQAILQGKGNIVDEYGCIWSFEDFKAKVKSKDDGRVIWHKPQSVNSWNDSERYQFTTSEFC